MAGVPVLGVAICGARGHVKWPNSTPGRRPYRELPRYAKGFDVAICPFVSNELTRNINPIKLRGPISQLLRVIPA